MGREEQIPGEAQELSLPSGQEEKILVLVRVRPLNEKEIARTDVSDWECINENTIIFKNSLPERSMFPAAYSFDRVFGYDCSTKQVYENGAREVTLSVVSGINSSIFAYGQTSSGKTYTMRGITEYAVSDIYDYIKTHTEREFVLRFSAMEIYNESVRDLLSTDTAPLRLLDDPERGTVVERLTEETLRDRSHVAELLSFCEAQRQIGETSLNETSSRSHQILRLTIESSAREYSGDDKSTTLEATVNFVDLAGSERASQTNSAGTRLKEGCHINRSLLTLGKVIRKLSKGKNAHIPYRDSKLTRILQNSLGGNARTAIICTMSPARSHVEQSRNTLLFATCAKEVATNAQVNVVMSDKALVKQLQRELAKLESEMKAMKLTFGKRDSAALLTEKDQIIKQKDNEIKELTRQCDLAQLRVENLPQSKFDEYSAVDSSEVPNPNHVDLGFGTCTVAPKIQVSENPDENSLLDDSTPKFVGLEGWEELTQKSEEEFEDTFRCTEMEESTIHRKIEANEFMPDPDDAMKLSVTGSTNKSGVSSPCKEVQFIEMEESSIKRGKEADVFLPVPEGKGQKLSMSGSSEVNESSPIGKDHVCDALKQKIRELQRTIDYLVSSYPPEHPPSFLSRGLKMNRSTSCRAILMSTPSVTLKNSEHDEHTLPTWYLENFPGRPEGFYGKLQELKYRVKVEHFETCASQTSYSALSLESRSIRESDTEDFSSIYEQNDNASSICLEKNEHTATTGSEINFPGRPVGISRKVFELRHGGEIINLSRKDSQTSYNASSMQSESMKEWDTEDTGIHNFVPEQNETISFRSQKYYGDNLVEKVENEAEGNKKNVKEPGSVQATCNWPTEFESWRKEIIELWNACNVPLVHRTYFFLLFKGDPSDSVYMEVELRRLSFLKVGNISKENLHSSFKALYREREALSKQVHQKFPRKEREELYKKWGIALNTKQRSLQLARRVWTYTKDINHITESAALVAKLVSIVTPSQAPKEMFGLSFLPASATASRRSYSWRRGRTPSLIL